MSGCVMFYVQHLWGVGHVYRATRIAHGLRRAGFETHLIWGGTEVPGFDFSGLQVHRLPPVRSADPSFSQLLHANGKEFTEQDEAARAEKLIETFELVRPDILITEAFPFGRRQMRFELLPLLEKAAEQSPRPMIVSSIRDIMQENRKPKRVEESCKLVSDFFDLVLVHGDPDFIRIDETLQGVEDFSEKIRYTGLVTPENSGSAAPHSKSYEVLASVGGGAFGKELLDCVLAAKKLRHGDDMKWLVSGGSELSDHEFEQLVRDTPADVEIVKHIPDMLTAMNNAEVSISHAGYNTIADILRSGCKSVLYPYTGGRETEQLRRSRRLSELGMATIIEPGRLSPENLVNALEAEKSREPFIPNLKLDGAAETGLILAQELVTWQNR